MTLATLAAMMADEMASVLRHLRRTKGLTLAQVASDLGIGERTLARYESDGYQLNELQRLGFAAYYGVPVERLR